MGIHRSNNRSVHELRQVAIETDVSKHAEGSALVSFGDTKVLCTATVERGVPRWKRGDNSGWLTAEYAMLPRATNTRSKRGQNGRATEIQRLIARALRSSIDLDKLGEETITLDCDVIQADGGTRCASITGGWVALKLAVNKLLREGVLLSDPLISPIAAISCGIYAGQTIADLDYAEDSEAGVDGNFIMMGSGSMIETQISAEGSTYSRNQLDELMDLAVKGIGELIVAQEKATA